VIIEVESVGCVISIVEGRLGLLVKCYSVVLGIPCVCIDRNLGVLLLGLNCNGRRL
jgi:hypothetical protein